MCAALVWTCSELFLRYRTYIFILRACAETHDYTCVCIHVLIKIFFRERMERVIKRRKLVFISGEALRLFIPWID